MSPWFAALVEFMFAVAAVQYLVGEATIFSRLRNKLPPILQELAACPSCAGFWLGCGAALVDLGPWAGTWRGVLFSGLVAVATTPVIRGLMALGWAVSRPAHDHHEHEEPAAPEAGRANLRVVDGEQP